MRVTINYGSYNARRYNKPWGALVTFAGTKPNLDFKAAHYLGTDDGGNVYIECAAGDIVASGQKDNRGTSETTYYIVQADGELVETDKVAAFEHWESRKVQTINPLADIATNDLIAELQRRGINVVAEEVAK